MVYESSNNIFIAITPSNRKVRLTTKVWVNKIQKHHPEFLSIDYLWEIKVSLQTPDFVVNGWSGELIALKWCETAPRRPKHLCVVYRELNDDGFVITAFFTSRGDRFLKRGVTWQKR